MAYTPIFEKPYPDGWEDGYGLTEVKAEYLNMVDNTIIKIEDFLKNNGSGGGGTVSGDYALLSETGYALGLTIDDNYVMSISLLNKVGDVLSTKQLDFPIESMVINAKYADGILTLTLQNGNSLDVDISDIVGGLVSENRTIAGIDLKDDITARELVDAERNVSGELYVDFTESTETEEVLYEYMPYPTDASGNKLVGQAGQIYVSNGDGTFSWLTVENAEGGAY